LDWSQDVLALADHLHIERFAVLAYSPGRPYGLACAVAIPERSTKVGIVSGATMFTEPELIKNINEGTRRFLAMLRESPFASLLFLDMLLGVMPRLASKQFVAGAAKLY
jgi:pimeloyl-ACP methyl ester carboxylesterase